MTRFYACEQAGWPAIRPTIIRLHAIASIVHSLYEISGEYQQGVANVMLSGGEKESAVQ
jgi:hypothetical protein